MRAKLSIGYFISPHGYGHAARACAVMNSLHCIEPGIRFEIFTRVSEWFFNESLSAPFHFHDILTDIGLVQKTSLQEDIPATLERLNSFLPFDPDRMNDIAVTVEHSQCEMIICDIAPLGIAIAHHVGIPVVLIENFTWDWIYEAYVKIDTRFQPFIEYLTSTFASATYHIQSQPVCNPQAVHLTTLPISRIGLNTREKVRRMLKIPETEYMVTITMGGIPWHYTFIQQLYNKPKYHFVLPGSADTFRSHKNVLFLPTQSGFFHPDLVNASDVVIGKVGYSTVAEVYHAGIPFGYILRNRFAESPILADFIQKFMVGIQITEGQFIEGRKWLQRLEELTSKSRIQRDHNNGADQAAQFISSKFHNRSSTMTSR